MNEISSKTSFLSPEAQSAEAGSPTAAIASTPIDAPPLVVDLDGTLIRSDLLIESGFAFVTQKPLQARGLVKALMQGKAALKAAIAESVDVDVTSLPYDQRVLALIEEVRASGRPVYLASASNEKYVAAVAHHLGVFDGSFGSTSRNNLSGERKAARLIEAFGAGGFDYVGDAKADLPVWAAARQKIATRVSASTRKELLALDPKAQTLESDRPTARSWIKLIRIHQWSKNALVFIPMFTSQHLDLASALLSLAAFVAFSMAASGVYIINDIADVQADRGHPTKKRRPLAAGTISLLSGLAVAPCLLVGALLISVLAAPALAVVLVGYIALTTAYTFVLKRKMMVDVVALASLYTIRVAAGAAAIDVPVSEWLLAFSIFVFASLALVKRYVELTLLLDEDLPDPTNRNYRKADLPIISSLAAAAAFNAITIFALYISSETSSVIYHRPWMLWFICPILMYWLGRLLILAHRRLLNDDPVVFALKDRNSLATVALIAAIMIAAY